MVIFIYYLFKTTYLLFLQNSGFIDIELTLELLFLFFRQLEAIIRMSESLAKMRLAPFATESDVDEALRLFQVSTLDAAMSGSLAGIMNTFI